ncbi:MAG: hypothetical protein KDB69_03895, partial [Acidimicrobiia bacterium]|nr:hypothetical protein [Acidimicrobiia bacterium]
SDDMIVTGGENVYLNVVGDAVRAISGVSDAYVLGVASPEWGTEIVAVVVSGRPEAALDAAVRDTLAPHEIPKRWVKLDRLPMLDNHKHDRAALQRVAELG